MRLTVSAKVNALLSFVIVASLATAVLLASSLFTTDLAGSLRKTSVDLASILASRVRTEMEQVIDQARGRAVSDRHSKAHRVYLHGTKAGSSGDASIDLSEARKGHVTLAVRESPEGRRVAQVAFPLTRNFDEVVTADFDFQKITDIFGDLTAYSNFLLSADGSVIATSDPVSVPFGKGSHPAKSVGQVEYFDSNGGRQWASFRPVGVAGLVVASQVSVSKVEAATRDLHRRTLLLGAALTFFAMSLGMLLSRGLTAPIRRLAKAAERVQQGDFSVTLASEKSGDEIERFAAVFNRMTEGLREREKIKATVAKFHDKRAAAQILTGEFALGGQRRNAVVLFSDIRGFATLAESLKPEDLISLLNRYFERMVSVIHKHGGIVDKFVGDAVLAVWGLEGFEGTEPLRAVEACLEMREELQKFNSEVREEGYQPVHIGMGLHLGILVAGNIGAESRMEYTVIGDTVNTAARIESVTKEIGTDLLVSPSVFDAVSNDFAFEATKPVSLRGKSGEMILYRVLGRAQSTRREGRAA